MQQNGDWIWTRRQRAVLAVLVLGLAAAFTVRAMRQPVRVGDPPQVVGERAGELVTKIDPNTADWAAWAALPGIGEKRAKEIVAWREAYLVGRPGEVAFAKPEDLTKVKGIGKATVEALTPFLLFPEADGQ